MFRTLTRRTFLASSTAPAVMRAAQQSRKSVLVLIGDDHSPIAGCYGNPLVSTPNLDRLARQGVRFTEAFCTTPSCSPSRSVMLTGLHNHANGMYGLAHSFHHFSSLDSVESLPKIAKAQGAVTGVIGKLHVTPPSVYPWDFESPGGKHGGARDVVGMAQAGEQFFETVGDRPFYLHVGFADPHRSGAPGEFGNEARYPGVKEKLYSPADVIVPDFLPDIPETRRELAAYYQSISRMDYGVGLFLDALEKSGRAKDTLIIYLGDNGLPFPGAKASPYDAGLKVAFMASSPEMRKRGHASNALVHTPDIMPTALDWMGLRGPSYKLHGRSLLPILESESPAGWDEIFFSHTFHEINDYYPFRGIRTRRYKYVNTLFPELELPLPTDLFGSLTWQAVLKRNLTSLGKIRREAMLHHNAEELYDIQKDPLETTNIAARDERTLHELRAKALQFRTDTKDPWLVVDRQRGRQL